MRVPIFRDPRFCLIRAAHGTNSECLTRCTRFSTQVAMISPTYHKRPLPESLISLSSKHGKELFREALAGGGMESYFALAEQFVTQSEPSYCALSSLAMVLNALNFDPKKVWKGAWRWVSEETLQCETQICGHSLEKVKKDGMDFDEFESLARCHGIRIRAQKNNGKNHSDDCSRDITQFRSYVESVCYSDKSESFIVANFSRKVLGQTGEGHFSPIGGYHKDKDLVLIMDVARFKYPPFWVPLDVLWASMAVDDMKTKSPRGYFILSTWSSIAAVDLYSAVIDKAVATPIIDERADTCQGMYTGSHDHSHGHSHSHSHSDLLHTIIDDSNIIGDCPPLIKTWKEFKKHSTHGTDNQSTCTECNTVQKN